MKPSSISTFIEFSTRDKAGEGNMRFDTAKRIRILEFRSRKDFSFVLVVKFYVFEL